jgi:hypothetical protein
MDILLLTITVVSLVVAFIMSAAAWRLSRDERTRSAARVAALATAARESEAPAVPHAREGQQSHERRTVRPVDSPVDVEAVAVHESRPGAPWAPARVSVVPTEAPDRWVNESEARSHAPTFASASARSGGRQRGLAVAACVLFITLVTGGYWTIFGDAASTAPAVSRSAAAAPLELVSMRHERRGAKLAITGLVRNPGAGTTVERLAAVVFLFDQQGAFVTSARAEVDFTALAPGDESPFVVGADAPANVARYRVSFRNEAGVVPHVDRRGQEPIARELP